MERIICLLTNMSRARKNTYSSEYKTYPSARGLSISFLNYEVIIPLPGGISGSQNSVQWRSQSLSEDDNYPIPRVTEWLQYMMDPENWTAG
jgi:hypothetical protein